MSDGQNNSKLAWYQKGNRLAIVAATVTALTIGGAVAVQAVSNTQAYQHMQVASAYKAGWRGHKGFAQLSEAEIEAKVERMVKHVAIEIDATPEQQAKISTLVSALAKDMQPVHARMRAAGKEMHDLLLAENIDRAALEKLRAARFAEAEIISKDLVNAVADVAEILTLEQRKTLEERIKEFRGMRHGRHRG